MARHGADRDRATFRGDASQRRDAGQRHDLGWRRKPLLHHRQQCLAAGQVARVGARPGDPCGGIGGGLRARVDERFHQRVPPIAAAAASTDLTMFW